MLSPDAIEYAKSSIQVEGAVNMLATVSMKLCVSNMVIALIATPVINAEYTIAGKPMKGRNESNRFARL